MRNSEIDFLQNAKDRLRVLNETIKKYVENFETSSSKEKQVTYNYIVSTYGTESLQEFTVNIEELKEIYKTLDQLL